MNRVPPLSSVAAFIQVAETGAFNEASRRLDLSPSATSKAVSRLEDDLGVKLLHRTTRSVSLTPEGERYLEGAKRLLSEMVALGEEVANTLADPAGRLTVSVPAALGRMWLVDSLLDFRNAWPKIEIELSLDDRAVDLAGEAVDVVIRAGSLDDSANLVARRLFMDPLIVCATPRYWNRRGRPRAPDDLANHDCLNFRNRRTGRAMPWHFEIEGAVRSQVFGGPLTVDDGEAVGRAARAGLGVSQMPGFMAEEALRTGELEEVLQDFRPPDVPFTALYLDRRLVSPRIRVFVDFLSRWKPPHPDKTQGLL